MASLTQVYRTHWEVQWLVISCGIYSCKQEACLAFSMQDSLGHSKCIGCAWILQGKQADSTGNSCSTKTVANSSLTKWQSKMPPCKMMLKFIGDHARNGGPSRQRPQRVMCLTRRPVSQDPNFAQHQNLVTFNTCLWLWTLQGHNISKRWLQQMGKECRKARHRASRWWAILMLFHALRRSPFGTRFKGSLMQGAPDNPELLGPLRL